MFLTTVKPRLCGLTLTRSLGEEFNSRTWRWNCNIATTAGLCGELQMGKCCLRQQSCRTGTFGVVWSLLDWPCVLWLALLCSVGTWLGSCGSLCCSSEMLLPLFTRSKKWCFYFLVSISLVIFKQGFVACQWQGCGAWPCWMCNNVNLITKCRANYCLLAVGTKHTLLHLMSCTRKPTNLLLNSSVKHSPSINQGWAGIWVRIYLMLAHSSGVNL